MTKHAKLLARIRQNPKNVAFHDLRTLLEAYGFVLDRTRGSHHSFVRLIGGRKRLIVIPYNQPLKESYVKDALDLIAEIEAEDGENA